MGVPDRAAMQRVAVEKVDVPEWGGVVYVRPLRARDVIGLAELDPERTTIEMTLRAACDEDGDALFVGDDAAAFVEGLEWDVVQRIGLAALKLNGLMQTGDEKKAPTETSATS